MKFLKFEFSNPLIIASGPLTRSLEFIKKAEDAGASAISTKLTISEVPYKSQLRCYSSPGMGLLEPTDSRLALKEGLELVRKVKKNTSMIVFANILAADFNYWGNMVKLFEEAGADIIEANFCCPHLGFTDSSINGDIEKKNYMGASIGHKPMIAGKITNILKNNTSIPIVCKLPPSDFLIETALSCKIEGADAIHIIGGPLLGLPPVDIYKRGKPLYPLMENAAYGSLMGAWVKNSTYRYIAEVAQKVDIPIIASGGIQNWQDCINMIMWGASMVSLCTEVMFKGFELVSTIIEGLEKYFEQLGIKDFSELTGLSLSYLKTPDQVTIIPGIARVDTSLCKKCGSCLKPGHCNAITMDQNGFPIVDEKFCLGCGICESLCKYNAIKMVKV